jgi:ribonuclease Z
MPFTVTILGSSSALPTSNRYLSAHLVNHDGRFFLIDCGEGTQIQLRRYKKHFGKINNIFISHIHGDHVFGLFGLISSFGMMGRTAPLHIYSHPLLQEIIDAHFKYFGDNIKYDIEFHKLNLKKHETIYDDGKLEVLTIPLKHRIPCAGFLFREKPKLRNMRKEAIELYHPGIKDIINIKHGANFITNEGKIISNIELTLPPPPPKSYAYCSDTKHTESIIKYIENISLLYHEATFLDTDAKLAKITSHSTALQAAKIAAKAHVSKLVIGHFSSRYKDSGRYLSEAKTVFENTILAEDGIEIII